MISGTKAGTAAAGFLAIAGAPQLVHVSAPSHQICGRPSRYCRTGCGGSGSTAPTPSNRSIGALYGAVARSNRSPAAAAGNCPSHNVCFILESMLLHKPGPGPALPGAVTQSGRAEPLQFLCEPITRTLARTPPPPLISRGQRNKDMAALASLISPLRESLSFDRSPFALAWSNGPLPSIADMTGAGGRPGLRCLFCSASPDPSFRHSVELELHLIRFGRPHICCRHRS